MVAMGYTDERIDKYLQIRRRATTRSTPPPARRPSPSRATPPTTPPTSARTWRGCTCGTVHSPGYPQQPGEFTDKADETQIQCIDCRQWCRWGCTTVARHQFVIEKDYIPFQKNYKFVCGRCSEGADQFALVRSKGYKQSIEDIVEYIMWKAQVLGATVKQVKAFLEGNAVLDDMDSVLVPATLDGSDRWNIMRFGAPKNLTNWPRPQTWTNNPTCYLSERLPGKKDAFYVRPSRRSDEIRFGIPAVRNWTPTPLLANYAPPLPASGPPPPQTCAAVGGGYALRRPRQATEMTDVDDYSSEDDVSEAVPVDAEVDDEPVSPPPPPPLPRMFESTRLMFSPPTPIDPPEVVSWCPAQTCVGICFCSNDEMDNGEHDKAFKFADFTFMM